MTVEFLEFKAAFTADDTGLVEGKAWDFTSADRVGDMIEPAAFASAVGKSLPMLFAHDQAQVVGTWESVSVEADGLKVKGRLLVDDVARAREVRALVRAKSVTGLSVGFMTRKSAPRKGGGRTITDLDLMEVSLVAIPAHPGAQISSVKELSMTNENTKTIYDLALELKAANDNIALVTKRLETAETALARPNIIIKADNDNQPSPERKAFTSFLRGGIELMPADETKSLVVSDDTRGGYLAPAEFSTEILKNLVEYSPVRQAARVGSTSAGSVILPKRTALGSTASWVGETETRPETGSTYGQAEIAINEMAAWVDVSQQLLDDAAVNVEAEVASDFAEEFGLLEGGAFISGNGVKKPMGLMSAAGITEVISGGATSITADALINLMYDLPAFYRNQGAWMGNGTTIAAIRKLKDGQGNYLWQPSYQAGQPETLLGRPIVEAVDMPDIAAGTYPLAFGDFKRAYRIYDRVAMSILRDPYTQATAGKVRFHARRRVGGDIVMAEALRKLKVAAS